MDVVGVATYGSLGDWGYVGKVGTCRLYSV